MENGSEFLIRNSKLVVDHLNTLHKSRCMVSAYFGEDNRSFLTSIISIDSKKQLMEIECSPLQELNDALLQSPKVLFRTELQGIKVAFSGKQIKQIKRDGEKIFVLPIPNSIFWMQRRQCFRANIPSNHTHCFCHLVLDIRQEDENGDVHLIPQQARFKVVDISVTGFAFLNVSPAYADYVQPSLVFKNCLLQLHDDAESEARINFEITNVIKVKEGRAIVAQRVGCRFTQMPLGFDDVVQRYVQSIELQHRIAELNNS